MNILQILVYYYDCEYDQFYSVWRYYSRISPNVTDVTTFRYSTLLYLYSVTHDFDNTVIKHNLSRSLYKNGISKNNSVKMASIYQGTLNLIENKPKFHLLRHVTIHHETTRTKCRACRVVTRVSRFADYSLVDYFFGPPVACTEPLASQPCIGIAPIHRILELLVKNSDGTLNTC